MNISEKRHTANSIASITKIYNSSKIDGQLHPEDIYILNAIYKLLNGCSTSLTDHQQRLLESLYGNFSRSSKYICNTTTYNSYSMKSTNKFIQAEITDCNTLPSIGDIIYYWQEVIGVTADDILLKISTGTYLDLLPVALKSEFLEGKDVEYTKIGLICFAMNKSVSSDKYIIYDDNETNVTDAFTSYFNTDLKTRIFISNNIYSHGIMNFKIKKI